MNSVKITIRERDEQAWEQARTLAEKRDLSLSRLVTRALEAYLKQHREENRN